MGESDVLNGRLEREAGGHPLLARQQLRHRAPRRLSQSRKSRSSAGPPDRYARLIEPHRAALGRAAYRLTGDPTEAQDLVQETLLRAYTRLHLLQGECADQIGGWLYIIQLNLFRERCRRTDVLARPRPTLFPRAEGRVGGFCRAGAPSNPERDPERSALLSLQHAAILHAVAALPPMYREALQLCAVEGRTYEEVAQRTGVPVGTIRSRINRGRRYLRRRLASWN
jgi:RNA polymerase sigma-70 factor (ECF subfamily)